MVSRIASTWTRQPAAAARIELVQDVDQWTVQSGVRRVQPLWKYSWPDGQQVYISQRSGEVEQYTTTASRIGAYLGPIPHWLYFTPFRKHPESWSRFVIWSSGIGTATAILGIVIGLWMYSPSKRYRFNQVTTAFNARREAVACDLGLIFGTGRRGRSESRGAVSTAPSLLTIARRRPSTSRGRYVAALRSCIQ
jgi:hypothetical protein